MQLFHDLLLQLLLSLYPSSLVFGTLLVLTQQLFCLDPHMPQLDLPLGRYHPELAQSRLVQAFLLPLAPH